MQFYRDKIEELYESLYKQYELCRKEYHVYPAGNLISARQGDKLRYFNARTVDGRYLRKDITFDFSSQTTACKTGRADKGTVCGDVWRKGIPM